MVDDEALSPGEPMNIVLLHASDWRGEQVAVVHDRRAAHIRDVIRAQVGDSLRVGLLGGACGRGVIEAMDPSGVQLRVELNAAPPARHCFDIVLALPRPKMLRRMLRQCAEFGVNHLHLIHSARVEKSYWQSPLLQPERLTEALLAGLERSRDTIAPQVHLHRRFRPFVEDELPNLCAGRPCWIADMDGPVSLAAAAAGPAVVMIGPEGGFVPFEVQLAESVRAQRVTLGERILSVDTALVTVLAGQRDVPPPERP
jgi:RsmE family RNA methyltransferase